MKAVIQRVRTATVEISGIEKRTIGPGLMILLGIGRQDGREDIDWLTGKIASMRIFEDTEGRTNLALEQIGGRVLVVSQFTLLASTRKGNRPSFDPAAPPDIALPLYESFTRELSEKLANEVVTGEFGAQMKISLVNDGPFTILLDSKIRE